MICQNSLHQKRSFRLYCYCTNLAYMTEPILNFIRSWVFFGGRKSGIKGCKSRSRVQLDGQILMACRFLIVLKSEGFLLVKHKRKRQREIFTEYRLSFNLSYLAPAQKIDYGLFKSEIFKSKFQIGKHLTVLIYWALKTAMNFPTKYKNLK